MLLQAYLKQKNIDAKIEQSKHAHIKYEHMLSEIRDICVTLNSRTMILL